MAREEKLPKSSETRGIDQDLNNVERAVEKTNEKKQPRSGKRRGKRRGKSETGSQRSGQSSQVGSTSTPALADRVASLINFNNPVGTPIYNVTGEVGTNTGYTVPGVMKIRYVPTFGPSLDNRSPLNQAKMQIFTATRRGNTSNQPYDAPDQMIMLLAVKSLFDMFMFAQRVYGIANNYSALNRYTPDALLGACGVNGKKLRDNLANYHYKLNVLASQVNMLVAPKQYSIFTDGNDYLSKIYCDDPLVKGQTFIFVPEGYYVYSETPSSNLKWKTIAWTDPAVGVFGDGQALLAILEEQINALLASGTVGNIFGDMLRVYPESDLVKAAAVPVDYTVMPVYDVGMLTQINNASILPMPKEQSLNVIQDVNTNAVMQRLEIAFATGQAIAATATKNVLALRHFLNLKVEVPTTADKYNATALQVQGMIESESSLNFYPASYGFVYIIRADIITMLSGAQGFVPKQTAYISPDNSLPMTVDLLAAVSKFDWAPLLPVFKSEASKWTVSDWVGDIANYTTIAYEDLLKFHEMRIMLAFDVPLV